MITYEPADWRPEPGDVAEVTNAARPSDPQVRVLRSDGWWSSLGDDIQWKNVTRARRLLVVDPASTVVLNPDNPDDMQRLSDALNRCDGVAMWDAGHASNVLRSLLPVVTPEPNGLGAVVELTNGNVWVRHTDEWHHAKTDITADWGDLRNVEAIKSHGVVCTCGAPDCNGGDQ